MQVTDLKDGIYRIEKFIDSQEKYDLLKDFVKSIEYKYMKGGGFDYEIILFDENCNKHIYDRFFSSIGKELMILQKLFQRVHGKEYTLNKTGSFIRLKKGSFIDKHEDIHSDLQGVMYFQTINESEEELGGYLLTHDRNSKVEKKLFPIDNSIVLFPGNLTHSVPFYSGLNDRYSLSFGFSYPENQSKNSDTFKHEVLECLDINL